MKKELIWKVFIYDFNSRNIKTYNVFDNLRFLDGLKSIKKQMKKEKIQDKTWFADEIVKKAMNAFWSKSEYEIIMTNVYEKANDCKVDIFTQLSINLNHFVDYIWNNLKLIKVR